MQKNISSITRGPRQSNFELLRIIAMIFILILHSNFKIFGIPEITNESNITVQILMIVLESITIIAVNIFILISGWFMIKPTHSGFSSFCFQCIYFLLLTYIIYLMATNERVTLQGILSCVCLNKNGWFIISYVGLYILSPIINKFLKEAGQQKIKRFLICFYLFSTIYGWIGRVEIFNWGYSTLSFIGLYVTGYYCHHYLNRDKINWLLLYFICAFTLSILITISIILFDGVGTWNLLSYLCPIVILESLSLLLYISKCNFKNNKLINFIASSTFAVYLLHDISFYQESIFKKLILYANESSAPAIMIPTVLIAVFTAAVILDQPRKTIWRLIGTKLLNKPNNQ